MGAPTVTELVEQAGNGDQGAWNELVDRFGNLVWSVVRSFRLDPATAADVSQTTWLRLVENLDRVRDPERLAGWLATTARNEALRVLRIGRRELPTVDIEVMGDPALVDPAAELMADERSAAVVTAFQGASEGCQQLLRLLAADPPLEYAEIAKVIDRPIGSIGPTRARCLEQLRRVLEAAGTGLRGENI
jgi:RNA polymerase sigma factor (sigma-70 family)